MWSSISEAQWPSDRSGRTCSGSQVTSSSIALHDASQHWQEICYFVRHFVHSQKYS
eukprot:m.156512 g.156512  ORF g.156512 m.156512 type:complete len:56 (-) comp17938_c0_seq3:2350-2517(-)